MESYLCVFDVSVYLHAGLSLPFNPSYKGIPTGGIMSLVRDIALEIKNNKGYICLVFDSRTDAKDILPEYKSSRCGNPAVRFQEELLYNYCKDYHIPNCFKVENYEADWLAADIFDQMRENHSQLQTFGMTTDKDWAHNITSHYETIVPANNNLGLINIENFENILTEGADALVKFNSISAYKVFCGDKSDNIKPFKGSKYTPVQLFNAFKTFAKNSGLDLREKESLLAFLEKISSGIDVTDLINRAEIIFPRKLETHLPLKLESFEKEKLRDLLSIVGCKQLSKKLGLDFIDDMGQQQDEAKALYQRYINQVSNTHYFESLPEEPDKDLDNGRGIIFG